MNTSMKKLLCALLALMMLLALTACGKTDNNAPADETPVQDNAPVQEAPAEEDLPDVELSDEELPDVEASAD